MIDFVRSHLTLRLRDTILHFAHARLLISIQMDIGQCTCAENLWASVFTECMNQLCDRIYGSVLIGNNDRGRASI